MNKKIQHICLIFAMEGEAAPLIKALGLTLRKYQNIEGSPAQIYEGKFKNLAISCLINGKDSIHQVDLIGPVPATLSATLANIYLKPDLIISCGTAGALTENQQKIGAVYFSEKQCFFHDRIVPLPKYEESAIGGFPMHDVTAMAESLGIEMATISSGSSLRLSPSDIRVMNTTGALIKEMECAAIAWVCSIYNTPFFAIKAVTNVLYDTEASHDQFQKNFGVAVDRLTDTTLDSICFISEKTLTQLSAL